MHVGLRGCVEGKITFTYIYDAGYYTTKCRALRSLGN